jgi:hypothetical protein
MATKKIKVKPSEIIIKHFISCGISNPYAYMAADFKASERTIYRYLRILDQDINMLKRVYIDKIIELSERAMNNRPNENTVAKLFEAVKK